MDKAQELSSIIGEIYELTNRLEAMYPGRHFTPDGHLVGSIGEVHAAERYGLKLFRADWKAHDGETPDGRLVQIKTTQRNSVGISEKPDYLIVLHIDENGRLEEIYNGPGERVWSLFEGRKPPKNGQHQISLSKLKEFDKGVLPDEKIPALS